MRLPPGGAVTRWAALRLHGAAYFDGGDGRLVALIGGIRRPRATQGVSVSRAFVDPAAIVEVEGIPVVTPSRALLDEVTSLPAIEAAVVAIDMALAAGLLSQGDLEAQWSVDAHRHRGPFARSASAAARPNSSSPQESRTRLVWELRAGLPRLAVNPRVCSQQGDFVLMPDLLDVEAGLAVEYDGAVHLSVARRFRDVSREDAARAVGLDVMVVTAPDLWTASELAERMRRRRRQALEQPRPRRWSLVERLDPEDAYDDDFRAWIHGQ